jgi:hypothetical protein
MRRVGIPENTILKYQNLNGLPRLVMARDGGPTNIGGYEAASMISSLIYQRKQKHPLSAS